jgi:hypothetical protein
MLGTKQFDEVVVLQKGERGHDDLCHLLENTD